MSTPTFKLVWVPATSQRIPKWYLALQNITASDPLGQSMQPTGWAVVRGDSYRAVYNATHVRGSFPTREEAMAFAEASYALSTE